MFSDEPVRINSRLAAVCCRSNRLSISEISNVPRRKYPRHTRLGFLMGDNVSFGVEIYLSLENGRIRIVPDRHEYPVRLEKLFLSCLEVPAPNSINVVVPQNFFHDRIPDEFYLRVLERTVLHY